MSYDENNIFAKILRGEIPCKKIYSIQNFQILINLFLNYQLAFVYL